MKNRDQLRHCVIVYNNYISKNVDTPVRNALKFRPEEIETLFSELKELMTIIANDQNNIDSLDGKYRSYLKSAILYSLKIQKEEANRRSELTNNREIKKKLEQEVEQIAELTVVDWFENTEAFETPKLEKFLIPQKKNEARITNNSEDKESILEMKPNFYGVGINLPAAWDKVKRWYKSKRGKNN
jgi:hypothetical protein